jgi:uncharacterized cupredoxin-like copper-binding protein
MDDGMRFHPGEMTVQSGETIRFVVRNEGKMNHELVIGSMDELKEHAKMMLTMPNMNHTEANMIRLAPGQQGELIWQFVRPGTLHYACLVPGHLEAGMIGKILVE